MTIGSILLGVALLIVVGLILARPFLTPPPPTNETSAEASLLEQKEILLAQISKLDFDHDTGKLPDEVYNAERAELVAATADVLKAIDKVQTGTAVADGDIEAAITQRRRKPAPAAVENDIEAAIAQRRRQKPAAKNGRARFCPQCGKATDPGDLFCAACGHQLHAGQAAA